MKRLETRVLTVAAIVVAVLSISGMAEAGLRDSLFAVGRLKPIDSQLKVAVGETAPDFSLTSVEGKDVTLRKYRRKKTVVLSFVPAAWTPVCSDQWPGYDLAEGVFKENDAVLLGITVDNVPTLNAWVKAMRGLWFPVLSDFWPHGQVASSYGVLRSDGVTERALIVVDKKGVIRYIDVHDINERPDLGVLVKELEKLK
ncbi:MAG: redoxin domain-containing protein [Lentisphaerae bacterium]|nr:redoxin domain-containing protein [Lentisphaerota bacterium]MBT4816643.1 redoxin domain-containing protein [Lentisphaerota bacterium]MBT5610062.1 redoxin domain-containing protein [Lentisphaerota bacterium]MBT7055538.1 redoxin domain-containing protein [Lentisphaerota bacterium]MBT7841507.1 redoxin domain-containing protein [Lentisphaerota bacterium]